MGTTSEKLTYLNTTKGLIKDKLNLGGANITTEPFRAYSSKLMGIYKDFLAHGTDVLWNNWEKVSGSGETLTLNNTMEGKMKVDLKGNTQQNGTPTPDTPIPVQVVSGDNTIKVERENRINNANLSYDYSNVSADKNTLATIDTGIRYSTTSEGSPVVMFKLFNLSQYIGKVIRLKTNFGSNGETRLSRVSNDLSLKEIVARTTTSGTTISYTVPSNLGDKEYLAFSLVVVGGNSSVDFTNLILTIDNNDMTYTPYVSQTCPISLGNIELCKIGTYQDSIVKDNGKWYLNKQIGKVVLDGSEANWQSQSASYGYYRYGARVNNINNSSTLETVDIIKSNYYRSIPFSQRSADRNETIYPVMNNTDKQVWFNTKIAETLDSFKTWLSTHNTIVYYVLATPTYEEITDSSLKEQLNNLENAMSYDPQTNISQTNDDLPFVLNVVALKEMS